MSPTARSLKRLRDRGYTADIVERRKGPVSVDLFGFIDILAVHPDSGEVLAIQATSRSNVSARVRKITDHENLPLIRKAGWGLEVWGWGKTKAGMSCRVVDLS